jgi:hypothetical protein
VWRKRVARAFFVLLRLVRRLVVVPPQPLIAADAENVLDGVHSCPGEQHTSMAHDSYSDGAHRSGLSSFFPSFTFTAECIRP